MKNALRRTIRNIAAVLTVATLLNPLVYATVPQTSSSSPATQPAPAQTLGAPVPAQIAQAHNVFLSNLGSDNNFPIDSTQVYNAIYQDLQTWGKYQLVSSPQQADLIF